MAIVRRALELGIGTGRFAIPLQKSGIEVHGIDASELMVAKMRAKPGGKGIPVTFNSAHPIATGPIQVSGQPGAPIAITT